MRARRLALALALVASAACSDGARRVQLEPTPEPTPVSGALAFVTGREVRLRDAAGTVTTLATLPPDEDVTGLAWTGDGRFVGWLRAAVGPLAVSLHEPATGRSATWNGAGQAAGGLGATEDGFVVVDDGGRMALVDPEPLFDEGEPVVVDLDVPQPSLLTAGGGMILVASDEGTSSRGGPQTVYEVTEQGGASELFFDGDTLPEGNFRNVAIGAAALTADGKRLVYGGGTVAGKCEFVFELVVRELGGGEVDVPTPRLPGFGPGIPVSVTTAPNGQTFAAVTSNPGDQCPRPSERSALFVLNGDRWVMRDEDAHWSGTSRDGRYAVIRQSGRLEVEGTGVADGVTYAAWSPR